MQGAVCVGLDRQLERLVYAVSLPAASLRRYFGSSSTGAFSHLRTVLRDKLVNPKISRTDFFSRKYIRLTLPIMAMVITPSPLLKKEAG